MWLRHSTRSGTRSARRSASPPSALKKARAHVYRYFQVRNNTETVVGKNGTTLFPQYNIRVDGTVSDLRELLAAVPVTNAWVEDVSATGRITASATILGSIDSPGVSAQVQMTNTR